MNKKKDEKDVLIVRDEQTGEISVVSGLSRDGTPKTKPAKLENSPDFLHFDRGGDVLDNFFTNFFRQYKEPSRFGFYRLAADKVDALLDVMKDLLKDPEANKEALAAHKIDTSEYEKKVQQEKNGQKPENSNNQKQEKEMEQKQEQPAQTQAEGRRNGYQPLDESKINWPDMEKKWGISREALQKSGDLDRMLNYGKSNLIAAQPTFDGEKYDMAMRFSLKTQQDGSITIRPHFIRMEPNLNVEFRGYTFTDEDKKALRTTGNLGHLAEVANLETGEMVASYISIDRKTNEILTYPASKLHLRDKIGTTPLTKEEQEILKTGAPLPNKEVELANGRKFTVTLQVNADQKGVEFVPGTSRSLEKTQEQTQAPASDSQQQKAEGEEKKKRLDWTLEDGSPKPITKWKGREFDDQQKQDYLDGKVIKLENMTDKEGQPCTLYVQFNKDKGRPYSSTTPPEPGKVIGPSNESKTQVAVNNEGKTNEETKGVEEPLQKGQVKPKNEKQKAQQEQADGEVKTPAKKQKKGGPKL